MWELVARLTQLQAQLAAHWSEIARSAAQRFVARVGSLSAVPSADQTLKLYEQWVSCAEEAYAATARRDDFARLQSELANVSAALLVEQRRHAESLVRAFGLPTRTEVDALYAHIKDLSRRLAQFEEGARPSPAGRAGASRAAGKSRGKPARGKRGDPQAQAAYLKASAADAGGSFAELTLRVAETLARLHAGPRCAGRHHGQTCGVECRQDDALRVPATRAAAARAARWRRSSSASHSSTVRTCWTCSRIARSCGGCSRPVSAST